MSHVAAIVYERLKNELSWTEDWEKMVSVDQCTYFARLESTPFTTMESILNFHVSSHTDDTDSGFGVVCWFDKFFNRIKCKRSQFRLLDYGLFFKPQQGTLTLFKFIEVHHQTIQNHGYMQLGLALAMKE